MAQGANMGTGTGKTEDTQNRTLRYCGGSTAVRAMTSAASGVFLSYQRCLLAVG